MIQSVLDKRLAHLEKLELILLNEGFIARFIKVNTAKFEEVESATAIIIKQFGKIDVLINNAGITRDASFQKMTAEQWQQVMDVNLTGVFNCCKAVSPVMIQNNYGRIINVISTSVKQPLPNLGVSNTIRAAVANWAKTMANELGAFGITVNNVLPGATETERLQAIISNKVDKTGWTEDLVKEEMLREIPMKRFGNTSEIAAVAAFLASPAASYVNGATIPVDGGKTPSI